MSGINAIEVSELIENTYPPLPDIRLDTKNWFRCIYDLYWKKVYAYCLYHTADAQIAEETLQDIFYSVWERRETLDQDMPIERYLVKAARNKVVDHFRKRAIHQKHAENILQNTRNSEHTTENTLAFEELSEHVTQLVERLPAQCQKVYRLSREEGMNNRQIASTLVISEKTVEFHLTKALAFLRTNLNGYGF